MDGERGGVSFSDDPGPDLLNCLLKTPYLKPLKRCPSPSLLPSSKTTAGQAVDLSAGWGGRARQAAPQLPPPLAPTPPRSPQRAEGAWPVCPGAAPREGRSVRSAPERCLASLGTAGSASAGLRTPEPELCPLEMRKEDPGISNAFPQPARPAPPRPSPPPEGRCQRPGRSSQTPLPFTCMHRTVVFQETELRLHCHPLNLLLLLLLLSATQCTPGFTALT